MNEFNAEALARLDAKEAIDLARSSGDDPIAWLTGNNYMPPLRAFGHAETVWQADDTGALWEVYAWTFEQECERADVSVQCPEYDNALYAVDLARFEYSESEDGENLGDDWVLRSGRLFLAEWLPRLFWSLATVVAILAVLPVLLPAGAWISTT